MMDDENGGGEHPDPTGPEPPEEETAARDGDDNVTPLRGKQGKPLDEQEAEEEPEAPEPPPIKADHQLSLAGLGRRGLPVSSSVSIMARSHPLDGMIKPDEEVTLVIRVRPNSYKYTPERNGDEIIGFKHVHELRIMEVATAGSDHADVLLQKGVKADAAEAS